jgi:hypothetical protein
MSSDTPGLSKMAAHNPRTSVCEASLNTLVLGEISQVTSMMRKNARWAGASSSLGGSLGYSSHGASVSAMSAGLLAAEDEKAGLAKELGLRGSKSRDKLKHQTAGSTAMQANGSRDGSTRGSAMSMNKPASSLLSGFAALRNDLADIDGEIHTSMCRQYIHGH